jgi:hypothetical protein
MIPRFVAALGTASEPSSKSSSPRGYVGRHRAPHQRYVAAVRMPVPTQLPRPAAAGRG